jgi:hypothetical protein
VGSGGAAAWVSEVCSCSESMKMAQVKSVLKN